MFGRAAAGGTDGDPIHIVTGDLPQLYGQAIKGREDRGCRAALRHRQLGAWLDVVEGEASQRARRFGQRVLRFETRLGRRIGDGEGAAWSVAPQSERRA